MPAPGDQGAVKSKEEIEFTSAQKCLDGTSRRRGDVPGPDPGPDLRSSMCASESVGVLVAQSDEPGRECLHDQESRHVMLRSFEAYLVKPACQT